MISTSSKIKVYPSHTQIRSSSECLKGNIRLSKQTLKERQFNNKKDTGYSSQFMSSLVRYGFLNSKGVLTHQDSFIDANK